MTDSVVPLWHGNNYQARIFWENAFNLLDPTTCVVEVTFEADGPKAFDDIVIKYDPPVVRSGPERVSAEYHQIKWHTESGGRFGYSDLIDPQFIGAKSISLLERLRQARLTAPPASRFTFVTTYRVKDGDPLADLISGNDKSLLIEKLFDGTTDASRMGKVRKLWREHLSLSSDDELRAIVSTLRIMDGYRSLEELRSQVNLRARVVGLLASDDTVSDFRYDELARQLKIRQLNKFTRDTFQQLCRDESLFSKEQPEKDPFLNMAIRSFLGLSADLGGVLQDNTLFLVDDFRERYLRDDLSWQRDIRPKVESFLRGIAKKNSSVRLILDAHASIAFLAGTIFNLKSGMEVQLVQKGRVGSRVWRADDATNGPLLNSTTESLGAGEQIAVTVNLSQSVDIQAKQYIATHLPDVGPLISFTASTGPGHQSVTGGAHAAALAEHVANKIRELKIQNPDAAVHIFAACPNAFLFYLGQQIQGLAPCIIYEFDFDRRGNKTYQPSFIVD